MNADISAIKPSRDAVAHIASLHREWITCDQHPRDDQTGDEALVIVNTVVGDSRTWRELYRPLAAHHRVLLIDITNQGRSPTCGVPIDLARQAREVCAVAATEGVTQPVWVGNSSSTSLACYLAAHAPTRKLILLSPLLSLNLERRIDFIKHLFLAALEDASLEAFHRQLTLLTCGSTWLETNRFAPAATLLRLRSLFTLERLALSWRQTFLPERDRRDTLASIRCPILLLRGAEEMLQPVALLERHFVDHEYEMATLQCGHNLLEEAATDVFARIRSFLTSPN